MRQFPPAESFVMHRPGSDGQPGVLYLTDVNPDEGACEFMLVSFDVHFATDNDFVVPPELSGLPQPALVQPSVISSTFTEQIDRVLSRMPRTALHECPSGHPGPFLPIDLRWDHKVAEVHRLHRLTSDWLHHLLTS